MTDLLKSVATKSKLPAEILRGKDRLANLIKARDRFIREAEKRRRDLCTFAWDNRVNALSLRAQVAWRCATVTSFSENFLIQA